MFILQLSCGERQVTVYHRGPCLILSVFNFYVNDLNYFVCNTSLRLYGEDTTEYTSDPSPMVLQLILACYQAGSCH